MRVDAAIAAEKISEYLYHAITIEDLNAWARSALVARDFGGDDDVMNTVKRLCGPVTWEDLGDISRRLGYSIRVEMFQMGSKAQSGRTHVVTTQRPSQRRVTKRMSKP